MVMPVTLTVSVCGANRSRGFLYRPKESAQNVGPVGQNVFEPCFRAARTQEIGNELRTLFRRCVLSSPSGLTLGMRINSRSRSATVIASAASDTSRQILGCLQIFLRAVITEQGAPLSMSTRERHVACCSGRCSMMALLPSVLGEP